MQADGMHGGPPRYHGIVDAFRTIVKTEGFRGLYKGVSPTTQRAAIVAAVELSSYDECKLLLLRYTNWTDGDKKTHFAASLMAGFLATVASSPTDVIKSRVMNQPVGPDGRGTCARVCFMTVGTLSFTWRHQVCATSLRSTASANPSLPKACSHCGKVQCTDKLPRHVPLTGFAVSRFYSKLRSHWTTLRDHIPGHRAIAQHVWQKVVVVSMNETKRE